jgi:hypothetical protein
MLDDTTTLTPEQKLKLLIANRPWETEPNNAEWVDEDTGYKCRIQRHGDLGHLCGYVGITKAHPLWGKHYSDDEMGNIDAHGGLIHSEAQGGIWWFGFDCSHAGDLSPRLLMVLIEKDRYNYDRGETYRTWEYVEREVRELSAQLRMEDNLSNQI